MATNLLILGLSLFAQAAKDETTLEKIDREITAVVEKVRPSVVQITAVQSTDPLVPNVRLTLSGVVYSKEGHVVTDGSGVEGAAEIRVLVGTKSLKAAHVASDRRTGVAVLKIDAPGLVPATLADKPARPGALAIVVGNSLGAPGGVATGSVSGLGRSLQVGERRFENMIQLTAAVHPGDCGGFVADSGGRLIGLVHSVYAVDAGDEGRSYLQLFKKNPRDAEPVPGQVVGFATPAEWVKFSAAGIIRHGRMVRGWLGLSARPLDDASRIQLGLPEGVGLEIVRVTRNGPAHAASLGERDVLVELDGKPIRDLEGLQWQVAQVEEPTTVKAVYLRNRERHEVELRIEIDPQK